MYDPASALKGLEAVRAAHGENAAMVALGGLATDGGFRSRRADGHGCA